SNCSLRITRQLRRNIRMRLQIILKLCVARQEFFVVCQRRILGELLSQCTVPAQKFSEAGSVPMLRIAETRLSTMHIANARTSAIVIAKAGGSTIIVAKTRHSTAILMSFKPFFLTHEGIWIFAEIMAHIRMGFQKLLEARMLLYKLLVLDQRRILAQLFCDF